MSRNVLAVDLDDVCGDRLGVIADLLADEGAPVGDRPPSTWDLRDWGVHDHAHFERLHYRAFVERPGYRMMRPLPGAVTALRTLYEHGYLIRILTGRLWTAGLAARVLGDTGFWVEANEIPADDIAFVTDKASVHADFYVEDGPHFLTALHSLQRRVIVFDQPYNQHCRGPRARSWEEVVRLVEQETGEGTG